jgi:hypothetical protein
MVIRLFVTTIINKKNCATCTHMNFLSCDLLCKKLGWCRCVHYFMDFTLSDAVYIFVSISVDIIVLVVTYVVYSCSLLLASLCILSLKIISAKDLRRNLFTLGIFFS